MKTLLIVAAFSCLPLMVHAEEAPNAPPAAPPVSAPESGAITDEKPALPEMPKNSMFGKPAATPNECKADIETLCAGVKKGGGRIAQCMRENAAKVSPACRKQWEQRKNIRASVKVACHDDVEEFCGDAKTGRGGVLKCMKDNLKKLSAGCKAAMKDAKGRRLKK